ncbi:uncharacterized protein LY89DRAFT_778329 [Mollisia scopiformis]|uniref:Uncharacterized protein n=1 Tax=Mollisia scopiformis TaxID=149040 RepID=A0A194XPI5_MOLSC|nr:uncharacterized protein LY89DRAFT_778329 [Mollisia scopiformis]KUJ21984.1 hypothetical protein LY89DRAFT_778329 [Mollisia scopiformis]
MSTTTTTTITDPAAIAAFNRGPVTTTFTPPNSCLSILTLNSNMYFGYGGPSYYFDHDCYPSSTANAVSSGWSLYYYSPAQCPLGWVQATRMTESYGAQDTFLSIGASTTAVLCCPSGYFFDIHNSCSNGCASGILSTSTTLLYINPQVNQNSWFSTSATDPSTITVSVSDNGYGIWGSGIPVWWEESDSTLFTSGPPTTSSTPTTPPTNTATVPPPNPTYPSGLSSGAKIGIGIGIPLALLIFGIVGFVCFRRFRVRRRVESAQPEQQDAFMPNPELQQAFMPKPELHGEPAPRAPAQELAVYSDDERHGRDSVVHYELSE